MKTTRLCPQCGSREISLYMGGVTGVQYECKQCGYRGSIIIETDEFEQKKYKKRD